MDERPATRADLSAVVDLFRRYETAVRGFPDSDDGDLTEDWDAPDFDWDAGTRVLEDGGRVVGYATVVEEYCDTVVDPDRWDEALLERLLVWCEAHPAGLEHYVPEADARVHALLARRGWLPARRLWRMRRELDGPSPAPAWPPGVTVRDYDRPADDAAVHALITRSFREIGGQHERTLEQWAGFLLETDRFDPALYRVVVDADGTVVGACLAQDVGDYGFVRQLAVAPAQRGRGLGLALLHEAFEQHAARGLPATVLAVDVENPTGALALYEKAGMQVVEQFTRWDRPAPA